MIYCAPLALGMTSRSHFSAEKTDIMGLRLFPTVSSSTVLKTRPKFRRALAASLCVALAATTLVGCAGDQEIEYKEQSVYEIYSQAVLYLEDNRYTDSAKYFDEVERQHPYSVWATTAKLMSAYAHYHASQYDEAVTRLDRFIAVHPGNRDIAYAYYLKALCYYERIADVRRDQEETRKALDSLQDVVTRFPSTPYGRDARLKIDLTRDHLAGKEMDIGRYYLNTRHYLAAINRFKNVVGTYSTTSHVPEALHRLVEAYTALGLVEEGQKAAAVLGFNYPSSEWYKDSYGLAKANETRVAEMAQSASDAAAADTERLAQPPQPEGMDQATQDGPAIIPAVKKKKPWYQFW